MKKAIVKYNGGAGALLCSKCRKIIKTFATFTKEENDLFSENKLPEQFCEECKPIKNERKTN